MAYAMFSIFWKSQSLGSDSSQEFEVAGTSVSIDLV